MCPSALSVCWGLELDAIKLTSIKIKPFREVVLENFTQTFSLSLLHRKSLPPPKKNRCGMWMCGKLEKKKVDFPIKNW